MSGRWRGSTGGNPRAWILALALTGAACESDSTSPTPTLPEVPGPDGPALLEVHPDNPRYFADISGEPVYLTGSHVWMNFQDMAISGEAWVPFDYGTYLEFLERHNHNLIRLWRWEAPVGDNWSFRPMEYERTGPELANDGELRFDLDRWNEAYFQRLRQRVEAAGERGIYVAIMLFQRTSVWNQDAKNPAWHSHPFNGANNTNGVDGDLDGDGQGLETHTVAIPEITRRQEAYVRKVIDTVNDLDNVLYEISNESRRESREWQYHMIGFIREYEARKPKQHPVGMSASGGNSPPPLAMADLVASPADWIGPAVGDGFRDDPPAATGQKVIIADTDHLWGAIGGTADWVWKSFTRGINPIFMDLYDPRIYDPAWGWGEWDEARAEDVRVAMGLSRSVAERFDLGKMTPRGELASSGYCLANPVGKDAAYIVYLPKEREVSVDLSGTSASLEVAWLDPSTDRFIPGDPVAGGTVRSFRAPFEGEAVLLIGRAEEK